MKKLLPFLILLTLLVSSSIADAVEIKAHAPITSVIVYPDRAMVTRTADLDLEVGEYTVIFEDLPANIDTDSLRTRGEGAGGVRIFSIESKKIILERPREEQIARLEAEIQEVQDSLEEQKARAANLSAERELVKSIGVYAGDQFSKEFITRQPEPEQWDAMVKFQRENFARLSKQAQETAVQMRELDTKLNKLRRELEELRGQSAREGQEITVSLSVLTAGRFTLSLSCTVFGARWYPTYDARADIKKETVEITYIGNVLQNTGEDWSDVDLSLSTARPAVGARMPEIVPWLLRPSEYEVDRFMLKSMESRVAGEMAPEAPAKKAVAEIVQRGTSVQFKIPKRMDIPSDNAYHRATILSKDLPAKLSYAATPRLSEFAYLTASLTNTTGAPWLSGKVSVFVDGDFVGTSSIKPVAANEKIDLSLGIDEGIKIKREELARKEDETRIFGKKKERMVKDKITVENHKSKPVELLIIDQIPVSQHDDIKVYDIAFSMKPAERDEDKGILKWKLSLAPGEKQEITIEFTVSYPLDMVIDGL